MQTNDWFSSYRVLIYIYIRSISQLGDLEGEAWWTLAKPMCLRQSRGLSWDRCKGSNKLGNSKPQQVGSLSRMSVTLCRPSQHVTCVGTSSPEATVPAKARRTSEGFVPPASWHVSSTSLGQAFRGSLAFSGPRGDLLTPRCSNRTGS